MRERQVGHEALAAAGGLAEAYKGCEGRHDPGHVVVADHDGFRRASSTGGINQRARVARLRLVDALEQRRRILGCIVQETAPRQRVGSSRGLVGVGAAPHNDLLELRQRLGGLADLLELRGAVAEAELRRRVVEDVARGVGAVRRVDARREPAGQDAAEVRDDPFERVEANNTDALARLQSYRDHRAGRLPHERDVVGPRQVPPRAVLLPGDGFRGVRLQAF